MRKLAALLIMIGLVSTGCAKHYVINEGMSKEEVLALWGKPVTVETNKNACCWEKNQEAWLYHKTTYRPREGRRMVVFENNEVKFFERWGKLKRRTL